MADNTFSAAVGSGGAARDKDRAGVKAQVVGLRVGTGTESPPVWPVQGQQHLLAALLAGSGVANWRLDLYAADRWPRESSVLADFPVASWTGYAQATPSLTAATVSGVVTLQDSAARTFTNSSGATQTAYGWILWDTAAGKLVLAKRFDAGATTIANGSGLSVTVSCPFGEFSANYGSGYPIVVLDEGWLDQLGALLSGTVPAYRLDLFSNDLRPVKTNVLADFTLANGLTGAAATPSPAVGTFGGLTVLNDSAARTFVNNDWADVSTYGWVLRNNTTGKGWMAQRSASPRTLASGAAWQVRLQLPFGPTS